MQKFSSLFFSRRLTRLLTAGVMGLFFAGSGAALAQDPVDANASPNQFVEVVANNALAEVKKNRAVQSGDLNTINQVIDQYVLPYVNFEKTTRLAAGRYWRQATPQQQKDLVEAFRGTLVRTYSGALANVDQRSSIAILPFRGDANADDVVVRSTLSQGNGPAVGVDYRLEKTPQGWKIYDLNVEGIWLIQNYRNQFAQQISQNGIQGLIDALNSGNK
ncbi:MlaC/ttg2D family ABC transporter substrate-binding protein [Pollutimonas thiosulfatoxidans]|uniref:ABC transporter n=1 Tax=Pollutimonas thiosulfatoxidans TaxID=2028345 RepID=A0A410GEQ1_9BURK|nr:ABC transporter substrate-binding protein [Pollutimonas thiosulfatoxidans]MBF6617946.1 ABC transporter substrate-binding protein [Candidimonas sp.]QAA94774.1 ABC transporter [Pollutimonas thiosulfatoxidans]